MFEWIVGLVETSGYTGIALLMLLENVFPPIPSEMIMPLGGFVAARGDLNAVVVVLAGTLGSLLGAIPWYAAGRWLGENRLKAVAARHGYWLTIDADDVGKAMRWFDRHGRRTVLFGRLIPAVRTLISAPAGVARMPLVPFLLYSGLGTLAWTAALTGAGFLLEAQYRMVSGYLDAASKIILGLIAVLYLFRLMTGGRLGARIKAWARDLRCDIHAVYLAARDPRVPWYAKAVALLIAAYAVTPVDLIPDFLPVIGHFDDMVLIPLGVLAASRLVPSEIMEEHRRTAKTGERTPRDWRVGAVVLALWAIALAFLVRALLDAAW